MLLFVVIAFICLLLTFSAETIKLLHISRLLAPKKDTSDALLRLKEAKQNLEHVRTAPMSGEYARTVKTMRAEQKVNDILEELQNTKRVLNIKVASIDMLGGYALKVVLTIMLVAISVTNRYKPVMIFNDRFNFQPLEGFMSFPTGVHNAVSVPVWVLSCNVTFHLISRLLKK